MYGLPQTTEIEKQLPKKAFYDKLEMKSAQRESFDADVSRMWISNCINSKTIPAISNGKEVPVIYVITVAMKRKDYDSKNIAMLAKLIPQKMLIVLQFEQEIQMAIYYQKLITNPWQLVNDFRLELQGHNLDLVWENLVKSVGDIVVDEDKSLAEQIADDERREKINKQIELLEAKAWKERQPRKKYELFEKIKKLKVQL